MRVDPQKPNDESGDYERSRTHYTQIKREETKKVDRKKRPNSKCKWG